MPRHPTGNDVGEIAMVVDNYPGKMKIAGRVVRLGLRHVQNLADGRVFEQFDVKLYDTATPYGDRYLDTFKLAAQLLEVCNISDSGPYCYEHQRQHSFTTSWSIPTPPRFDSVEEADRWMAEHEESVRVRAAIGELRRDYVDTVRLVGKGQLDPNYVSPAFDPDVTPDWQRLQPCPEDPCARHGCVGPHADIP